MSVSDRIQPLGIQEIWKELEHGVRQALAREPMSTARYMELYTYCYNYCAGSNADPNSSYHSTTRLRHTRSPQTRQQPVRNNPERSGTVYSGHELYVRLKSILENHLQVLTQVSS